MSMDSIFMVTVPPMEYHDLVALKIVNNAEADAFRKESERHDA